MQDDGAFAIAQALKANEDVAVTSINLASNFLTKYGQVNVTFSHFSKSKLYFQHLLS
jgi:hypothetical protein